jgi:hypothetical protein
MKVEKIICFYGKNVSLKSAKAFVNSQHNKAVFDVDVEIAYQKINSAPLDLIWFTPKSNLDRRKGLKHRRKKQK